MGGPSPSTAQPSTSGAFSLLRLDASARAAALGGAFVAVDDGDATGLFYNPALLRPAAHRRISMTYLNHIGDLNAGFLAGVLHREGLGTLGAGLRFLSWGQIDGANEVGERTGSFGAGELVLTAGLSRAWGTRWRYGANVHVLYSYIEAAEAVALAADLGLRYYLPAPQITIAATVNHLGRAVDSFGPSRNEVPLDVRLGISKQLRYLPLLLSVTAYNLHEAEDGVRGGSSIDHVLAHLALGGELQLTDAFAVRASYNHRRSEDLALQNRLDPAGLAAGFGLRLGRLGIDYAYHSWSSYGGLHWLTLRTSF